MGTHRIVATTSLREHSNWLPIEVQKLGSLSPERYIGRCDNSIMSGIGVEVFAAERALDIASSCESQDWMEVQSIVVKVGVNVAASLN